MTTGDTIYFTTEGGDVIALDDDGEMAWRERIADLPLRGPVLDAEGNLLVTVSDGQLVKIGGE